MDWRHTGRSGFFTPGGKVCLLPTSASGWVLRHWWLPQPPRRKEKWQSKNNCHRHKGCDLTKFHPVANGKEFLWTKIVLTYREKKNVLMIKKNVWNSRLKTENLQNFWDHWNNLFKQWKVRTIFGNRMLFNLFLEVSHI